MDVAGDSVQRHHALLAPGDRMEEGAADQPAPAAGFLRGASMRIRDQCEGLVPAGIEDRGVVELVTPEPRPGGAERAGRKEARVAVAEAQPALGEAGRDR